jgi:hypothetical protein
MVSAWWLLLAGAIGVSLGMMLFALLSMASRAEEVPPAPPVNQLLT